MTATVTEPDTLRTQLDKAHAEYIHLEVLWTFDAKCEAEHEDHRNLVCSIEPVALLSCACAPAPLKVCQNTREHAERLIESNTRCKYCFELVSECWSVRSL